VSVGLLFDATLCIGCGACEAACKEANELPGEVEERTTAYTWTVVEQREGVYVRRLCMHCLEPTCVSVCPVGALSKTRAGPVVYDPNLCIGCRYCIMACPFGVPKYQWDRSVPVVGKCVLCAGRLRSGLPPACASVCPTGATRFGEREQLLEEARSRIAREPGRYVPHVYGSEEVGGTSVLLLSSVPFERLGLPVGLPREPLPLRTWQVLSQIPDFVVLAGVFLYGLFWITRRREEVREAEDRSRKPTGDDPPRGRGSSRRSPQDRSP
jgi:formate dehydrogenase iron-sulfur subunit